MFKKQNGGQQSTQTSVSNSTRKSETPPTPTTRTAEPKRVEPRGATATSRIAEGGRRPSHEQIAVQAYHLWQSRGEPFGSDWEDWLEAERRLGAAARGA